MPVVVQLGFVDHLTPLMTVASAIIGEGVPADDVPAVPDRIVLSTVVRSPSASKCTVFMLPSPEFCEWLGRLSLAADKRLTRS